MEAGDDSYRPKVVRVHKDPSGEPFEFTSKRGKDPEYVGVNPEQDVLIKVHYFSLGLPYEVNNLLLPVFNLHSPYQIKTATTTTK